MWKRGGRLSGVGGSFVAPRAFFFRIGSGSNSKGCRTRLLPRRWPRIHDFVKGSPGFVAVGGPRINDFLKYAWLERRPRKITRYRGPCPRVDGLLESPGAARVTAGIQRAEAGADFRPELEWLGRNRDALQALGGGAANSAFAHSSKRDERDHQSAGRGRHEPYSSGVRLRCELEKAGFFAAHGGACRARVSGQWLARWPVGFGGARGIPIR